MRRFIRPPVAANHGAVVRLRKKEIADKVRKGKKLRGKDFEDHWSRYKADFSRAQHGRCGFCERHVTDTGHVEHFAPKLSIGKLVAAGRELPDSSNVRGRRVHHVFVGYWWLAYDWRNWLFACERCNTAWKKTLFPIKVPRNAAPKPRDREVRLLLNPFSGPNPVRHLVFDKLGQIAARKKSPKGAATIETCGLDRESLRGAREAIAEQAHLLCGRVLKAQLSNDLQKQRVASEDLLRMTEERYAHSGMVAAIVFAELGVDVKGLKRLAK